MKNKISNNGVGLVQNIFELVLIFNEYGKNLKFVYISDLHKFSRSPFETFNAQKRLLFKFSRLFNIEISELNSNEFFEKIDKGKYLQTLIANVWFWPILNARLINRGNLDNFHRIGISYGADFLYVVSSPFDLFFNIKYQIERKLWKKTIKSLDLKEVIYPGFIKVLDKNYLYDKKNGSSVIFSNQAGLRKILRAALDKNLFPLKFYNKIKECDLVISIDKEFEISTLKKILQNLEGRNGKKFRYFIKPHPHVKSKEKVRDNLVKELEQLGFQKIAFSTEQELKFLPLEMIFIINPRIIYVGFETSAHVFQRRSQIYLVPKADRKIKATDKRSYYSLYKLIDKFN